MKQILTIFLIFASSLPVLAQEERVEKKIKHADPVVEDLTTELGVDKGMKELNVNFGYRNLEGLHHSLLSQLEFEFSPINNLGFEILLPYTTYLTNPVLDDPRPDNKLEFLQWTGQYTIYQSFERQVSLAIGFENSFESQDPYVSPRENKSGFSIENIQYQPFLILAKNWNEQYFLLFKGGTEIDQDLEDGSSGFEHLLTTAFHYSISNEKDNYVGIELNKSLEEGDFEMFIRPQLKIEITDKLNIGTTIGIPAWEPETNWTAFMRVAYEL